MNFKALTDCSHLRDEIASDLNENLLSRKLRLWAFKRRKNHKKWYNMISYMATGKSANFYTIKLWRELPYYQTFAETECGKSHTIKLSFRPERKKSYYQTLPPKAVNFFFFARFFSESEICAYIYSQNLLIYIYAHSKSQPRACGAGRLV